MDEHMLSMNASTAKGASTLAKAKQLLKQQNFAEAQQLLEEVLATDSLNPDANYILGQIYELNEDFTQASECYSRLMEINPSIEMKYKLAQSFQNTDDYQRAYILMKEIYEHNPSDTNMCEQFAHVARVIGKSADAVEAYNKILETDKNDMVALTQLSEIYYDEGDKLNHYLVKAKVHYLENMLSGSIDCLKRALNYAQEDDDLVNVLLNLGKVLTDKGNFSEAIEQYQFVLASEPENELALKKIEELEKKIQNYDEYSGSWIDKLISFFK